MSIRETTPDARLPHLEIYRGGVLLMILVGNMVHQMDSLFFTPVPGSWPENGLDQAAFAIIAFLTGGAPRGEGLAAFAFGIGIALLLGRPGSSTSLVLRRMGWLAVFGLAHGVLLFAGDFLFHIALWGAVVLLTVPRMPVRVLPILAAIAFLAPIPGLAWWGWSIGWSGLEIQPERFSDFGAWVLPHGADGWIAMMGARLELMFAEYNSVHYWGPPLLGYYILGYWLGVSGRVTTPAQFPRFYRVCAWVVFPVGLLFMGVGAWLMHGETWMQPTGAYGVGRTLHHGATVALALGGLAVAYFAQARLAGLAPAGRLMLSLYIMQSIAWAALQLSFDLSPDHPWLAPIVQLIFCLWLFGVQVLLAQIWLKHFRLGPLEWLWRSAYYREWLPLRARTVAA